MKNLQLKPFAWVAALCWLATRPLLAADLRGEVPSLDQAARFWVYRNSTNNPHMPFLPYGWMTDYSPERVIKLDLACPDFPHLLSSSTTTNLEVCIRLTIDWTNAAWAGVAFISGPDKPAWWGDTKGGRYYDLSKLPKKKLVVYLRGEKGDERVTIQMGILAGRAFGDSLVAPVKSDLLQLSTAWRRFEIDLSSKSPEELSRICNGFGILLERSDQTNAPAITRVYVDDIFFE